MQQANLTKPSIQCAIWLKPTHHQINQTSFSGQNQSSNSLSCPRGGGWGRRRRWMAGCSCVGCGRWVSVGRRSGRAGDAAACSAARAVSLLARCLIAFFFLKVVQMCISVTPSPHLAAQPRRTAWSPKRGVPEPTSRIPELPAHAGGASNKTQPQPVDPHGMAKSGAMETPRLRHVGCPDCLTWPEWASHTLTSHCCANHVQPRRAPVNRG